MNAARGDAGRPWLERYAPAQRAARSLAYSDAPAMFAAAVARAPERPAIRYFDGVLSYREVDEQSSSLALALLANGFAQGDRLGLYLQNVPQFVIAQLAAWKAGGIAVPINPMNKARELRLLLEDAGVRALVMHPHLYHDVAAGVLLELPQRVLPILTSERAYQSVNDTRVLPRDDGRGADGTFDLAELLATHRGTPPPVRHSANDIAMLVYTSGTTGLPKGAMTTHANITFTAQVYRDWLGHEEGGAIYAIAPLFHITGLIAHVALAQISAAPLSLTYRFDAAVALETIREHQPVFTMGAITAFIAMMHHPSAEHAALASLRRVFSGGAGIPPSVVEQFAQTFGHTIHNAYGLTESTSPSTLVPLFAPTPVDPASGSLSIGVPVYDTDITIVAEDGTPAATREIGELVISGPQIVSGYWNKPEETRRSLPDGRLATGDVGFMDEQGWFYIVDRKKDMINAAGYKVWPREIEDVLYTHPAIREAAVVGIPDAYRGETVKAVVSFKPGTTAEPDDLIAFCRERMAAYKVPRVVMTIDELPKTPTGKILRRLLREPAPAGS